MLSDLSDRLYYKVYYTLLSGCLNSDIQNYAIYCLRWNAVLKMFIAIIRPFSQDYLWGAYYYGDRSLET